MVRIDAQDAFESGGTRDPEVPAAVRSFMNLLAVPASLVSPSLHPPYETESLRRLLSLDRDRDRLRGAIREVAGGLLSSSPPGSSAEGERVRTLHLRTPLGGYWIRAFPAPDLPGLGSAGAVVRVGRTEDIVPHRSELEERLGLSPREVEVAYLLARRWTNAEIARSLSVSPHTVRRHTERILKKLDLPSRTDVRTVICSSGTSARG